MQNHWTKDDVAAAWQRFERTYAHDPVAYRFLCGHCIQDETDEDALDYNIIGVWLVCHRKYRDWSTEKSYDLAWILEFYAGVSHDDSTVHQKNKVLPEKDEAIAEFSCKR